MRAKLLLQPWKMLRPLGARGFFNWMPDKLYIHLVYRFELGKNLNLESPKLFNEKLQWLKIYDQKKEYSSYVDKYEVRQYVADTIGESYLIPLIGVYEDVSEIEWDMLPEKFILKCTHGSHCHVISTDRSVLNIEKAKKDLKKWLNRNWFWFGREWPYKNIKPRIVCEEFISELSNGPDDHKIMCFNGKPKIIQIHKKNSSGQQSIDFYDLNGDMLPISKKGFINSDIRKINISDYKVMLELATTLARGKKYLRTDFYNVNGKIYFGEMTFFDSSGFIDFQPEKANSFLGELLSL